jgi:hypothetical protein
VEGWVESGGRDGAEMGNGRMENGEGRREKGELRMGKGEGIGDTEKREDRTERKGRRENRGRRKGRREGERKARRKPYINKIKNAIYINSCKTTVNRNEVVLDKNHWTHGFTKIFFGMHAGSSGAYHLFLILSWMTSWAVARREPVSTAKSGMPR